jgi:enhancing lycopene biosynthesis protein 2
MKKKIGVVLSGCGVYDGSEIHESVITLLAIDRNGAQAVCMAPNIDQMHVVNHLTGEEVPGERRNVLVEAARIARGEIKDISTIKVEDLDALVFPGGFGAAKNLCTFALDAENYQINPEVLAAAQSFIKADKPLGFMCIAPAMIPLVFGEDAQGTIGKDRDIAESLMNRGLAHVDCDVDDIIVDEKRKLVSTPAYMLATSLVEAASGINKLVKKVISLS